MLGWTLVMMACNQEPAFPDLGLSSDGSRIQVGTSWQECADVTDCVQRSIACDHCCEFDAVSAARADEYVDAYREICADYEGGVCDCTDPVTELSCVEGRCELTVVESFTR